MRQAARKLLRGLCGACPAEVKPEEEEEAGDEGADGVEERVPGRSGAAGDEGLVDFVERGIACRDRKSGECPRPAPSNARAAHTAKKKNIEDEIFCKVRGLADEKVDDGELVFGKGGKEPAKNRQDNRGSMIRGKGVGRKSEDATGPDDCRPPGAQPGGNERHAFSEFVEFRGGARIAPGLFGQERLQESFAKCGPLQSLVFTQDKKGGPTTACYSMR